MLMSRLFVRAELPIESEAQLTIGAAVHVPRLRTANTHAPLKTHTVLCQHIETANCATQKDYYGDTKQ